MYLNEIEFNPLFKQLVINRQRTVRKSIFCWVSGTKTNLTVESATPLRERFILTLLDRQCTKA